MYLTHFLEKNLRHRSPFAWNLHTVMKACMETWCRYSAKSVLLPTLRQMAMKT